MTFRYPLVCLVQNYYTDSPKRNSLTRETTADFPLHTTLSGLTVQEAAFVNTPVRFNSVRGGTASLKSISVGEPNEFVVSNW
jgi:hypothetical protein